MNTIIHNSFRHKYKSVSYRQAGGHVCQTGQRSEQKSRWSSHPAASGPLGAELLASRWHLVGVTLWVHREAPSSGGNTTLSCLIKPPQP